jgi:hypothetical protein
MGKYLMFLPPTESISSSNNITKNDFSVFSGNAIIGYATTGIAIWWSDLRWVRPEHPGDFRHGKGELPMKIRLYLVVSFFLVRLRPRPLRYIVIVDKPIC